MKDLIRRIIKESTPKSDEDKIKDRIVTQIEKLGLFKTLEMLSLSYTKIFSMGIGPEYLTRNIKQQFIQDYFKNIGYGISLFEIDEEPIFYNENESEYREIIYIGQSKVSIIVWDKESWDTKGEFGVLYYNLDDDMIDRIFDIVIQLYDNNIEI
jgi:hypothetical protein